MNIENRAQFIKKLLYQSNNRGCKETDLIIGQFAKHYLEKMPDEELKIFAVLLEQNDNDIYDWYTRKKPLPEGNLSNLMTKILKFSPDCK